ncbi:MAG: nucleotide exchange factor GrpE [Candidatus Micrarchaeia archaeon]
MANEEEKGNESNKKEQNVAGAASAEGGKPQDQQAAPQGSEQAKQEKKQQQESELEKKEKEIAELKDRFLRLAAEFDNYKKKVASDIQSAKDIGKAELIAKLLPAIDAFEIAIYSVNGAEQQERDKGFELVFSELYDALKAEGLREIEAKGKYDPYKHEVVLTRPSDKEEGSVIEVVRKGYMFNGILLRPASVIVSNGKKE